MKKPYLSALILLLISACGIATIVLLQLGAFSGHGKTHPWDASGIYIACTAKETALKEVYLCFGPPYPDSVYFSNIHILDDHGNNIVKYDYNSRSHCVRVGHPPIGDIYHLAIYALHTHYAGINRVTEMTWFKGSCTLQRYSSPSTPKPEPTRFTLTLTTSKGGRTDPPIGSYTYSQGTQTTISAIPNSGYVFSRWELDGSPLDNDTPLTLTINKDHTLHAVFADVTAASSRHMKPATPDFPIVLFASLWIGVAIAIGLYVVWTKKH